MKTPFYCTLLPPIRWVLLLWLYFGSLALTASAFSAPSVEASSASASSAASSSKPSASLDSIWNGIPEGPPDAILGIAQAFRACEASNKVNVCVGAYRDEQGQPWVLPSVRAAEKILLDQNENKEYLPIEGDAVFIQKALSFAYGKDSSPLRENRIAGVQSLSGTGACRIGGHFLANFYPNNKQIFVPDRKCLTLPSLKRLSFCCYKSHSHNVCLYVSF